MNKKCIARQRSKREELKLLRVKDRESVKEIIRLHRAVRQAREDAQEAVRQVTDICERIIVAAMGENDSLTIYPGRSAADMGKVLACMQTVDNGVEYRLIDPAEIDHGT